MFKKRTFHKESTLSDLNSTQKPSNISDVSNIAPSGINLKKDIQEMESIIGDQKLIQIQSQPIDTMSQIQKTENSQFKTKKINKFTNHILKKLPSISPSTNQSLINNKIDPQVFKPSNNSSNQIIRPILSNYGLLDKSHFKSSDSNTIELTKTKDHHESLVDYYVKKKIEEMNANNSVNQKVPLNKKKNPEPWEEVLLFQKQYLAQEEKIKNYSMEEIQKKLEKLAQDSIKSEVEKRASYLKELLQNEHERMEYASKKELKILKQQKERIERELNSKYRESGRRHFIDSIKNSLL